MLVPGGEFSSILRVPVSVDGNSGAWLLGCVSWTSCSDLACAFFSRTKDVAVCDRGSQVAVFIDFDRSIKLAAFVVRLHGQPDPVKQEPRGFLGHADRSPDLVGTDAVFGVGDSTFGTESGLLEQTAFLEQSPLRHAGVIGPS